MTLLDDFVTYAQIFLTSGVRPSEHSGWKLCLKKSNTT